MSAYKGVVISSLAAGALLNAQATPVPTAVVDSCLRAAAHKHAIAYALLRAIAAQESGFKPNAMGSNANGSTDYGLMQINSAWLPVLARYGIRREHLMQPCTNADVGAWILAQNFARMGVTWRAVGAYNAATEYKRVRYAQGVYARLTATQAAPGAVPVKTLGTAQADHAPARAGSAPGMGVIEEAYADHGVDSRVDDGPDRWVEPGVRQP